MGATAPKPDATPSEKSSELELPVLDLEQFRKLNLPPQRLLLPWLREGGLMMVFGPRGIGKTYFNLSLAVSLACGDKFIKWKVGEPVGVLVVDGEMAANELQRRLVRLIPGDTIAPLRVLSHELVFDRFEEDLNLGYKKWKDAILSHLDENPEIRVLIIDNLSCLLPTVAEDKRDEWAEKVLPFLMALRRRSVATILVHHSGKGGQQRGTSAREDPLDTVIQLSELSDHDATQGAAFQITFTKSRGCFGDDLTEIEAYLDSAVDGEAPKWTWKPVEQSNKERLLALVRDGVTSVADAAEELGLSRGYVSKLKQQLQKEGKLAPGRKLQLAES